MTSLLLICHGATAALRQAAFPLDEALEPRALENAASLTPHLRRVDAAWTSPARRAQETAAALGLTAAPDPALSDIDYGAWAGRSLAEIEASDPTGLARWMTDPAASPHGGETILALITRVAGWLEKMQGAKTRCVAVTHPAVIRAAILIALDAPPISFWRVDIAPLSFTRLQGRAGRWTLSLR
jgi:broad specificity phosphatase PhoE